MASRSTASGSSGSNGRISLARTTLNSDAGNSGKKASRRTAPPTPGKMLREFLVDGERVSQEALAEALRVSRVTVNQLINGRQAVTAEMALRLAKALSTTPELWLNLQRDVDLDVARRELQRDLRLVKTLRKPLRARELFYELED